MASPAPAFAPPPQAAHTGRIDAIVVEYRSADPCRQQAYAGATPVQAVRAIAERLGLPPVSLGFRIGPLWETDVFARDSKAIGVPPTLASITLGLAFSDAVAAADRAAHGALR